MSNKLKKYWWIIAIVVIAVILLPNLAKKTDSAKSKNNKSKTYTVKRQNLTETLTLSGKIQAEEKVTLRFQTSGKLNWVGVKEGDYVKKYQAIATLDQYEVKKKLEKELNDYLNERWDFEQTHDDYEGRVVTDAIKRILEKAQFDLNNTVLDVEIQNLSVELATLTTPIEGIVTRVTSRYAGVNITPAQSEFEVVNPAAIYLSVAADQTEVTKIKREMETELTFDAFPQEKFAGTVESIAFAPKAGESSTVYEIKITLNEPNTDYRLRLEMTADALFVVNEKNDVLAIPSTWLKEDGEKRYVLKGLGRKKVKTYLETGDEWDSYVEILKGLAEGDVIYAQ